jgi:hypothetical protein
MTTEAEALGEVRLAILKSGDAAALDVILTHEEIEHTRLAGPGGRSALVMPEQSLKAAVKAVQEWYEAVHRIHNLVHLYLAEEKDKKRLAKANEQN